MQVLAMTDLVQAYQRNDIAAFERILKSNKSASFLVHAPFLLSHSLSLYLRPGCNQQERNIMAAWLE